MDSPNIRSLIEMRRNARRAGGNVDVAARFSTVSEEGPDSPPGDDTPSVYSSAIFSPAPSGREHNGHDTYRKAITTPRRARAKSDATSPGSHWSRRAHTDTQSFLSSGLSPTSRHIAPESEPETSQLSNMGPTVRIHGKAPWEMDPGDLSEEGELSDSSTTSRVFSKKKLKEFRIRPRSSATNRPSTDSGRKSTNERGPPQQLSQASKSATSLIIAGNSGSTSPRHHKFSMPRLRPQSPSSSIAVPASTTPSPRAMAFYAENSNVASNGSPEFRSSSPVPSEYSQALDPRIIPSPRQSIESQTKSNQHSPSGYDHAGLTRRDTHSRTSSDSTLNYGEVKSLNDIAKINSYGQEPLTPHSIRGTEVTIVPNSLKINNASSSLPHGWHEPSPQNLVLISLKEAQEAQARERTRSAAPLSNSQRPAVVQPFPNSSSPQAETKSLPLRDRARSISAGAQSYVSKKPSPPLQQNGVEPPAKSLKHKKSGFMRLFNGKERDPPPPIPHRSESFPGPDAKPRPSIMRVPPPSISLPSHENLPGRTGGSNSGSSPSTPRRIIPPAPINTANANKPSDLMPPLASDQAYGNSSGQLDLPRSAPPSSIQFSGSRGSDFPGLSLRPVSTLFSAHFAEHIMPDGIAATDSPESSTDSFAGPLTPTSLRSELSIPYLLDQKSIMTVNADEDSALVRSLRAEIIAARKIWQHQMWELEGQIKDLRLEVEDLRSQQDDQDYCDSCGRGNLDHGTVLGHGSETPRTFSVVDRPRARTGDSTRFASKT